MEHGSMQADVVVLGAGMIGVSIALHLRKRGKSVVLLDRRQPAEEASYGNGGVIHREGVFPYTFPREISEILRVAGNGQIDAVYHWSALPSLARPMLGYWRHSEPKRYAAITRQYAPLIAPCVTEHQALALEAGTTDLLRPVGYLRAHTNAAALEAEIAKAEKARREFGVNSAVLDPAGLNQAEPHLRGNFAGAVHWVDSYAVNDPQALALSYVARFQRLGGAFVIGDAGTLARQGAGWRVGAADGTTVEAAEAVVALGIWSDRVTRRFGYAPPLFGKRGYHVHFKPQGNAGLSRPVVTDSFLLAPMRVGIRLTTGAEFAAPDAPATPVQLRRAEPIARGFLPLGEAIEPTPWMGVRPCLPDMMPIIGPAPSQKGLWLAFGHAHHGFTLGPVTGRLLAEMMTGDTPCLDPTPFRADRF
jgi:D-amino-acid dehydrogenase